MKLTLEELREGNECPHCGQDCVLRKEHVDYAKAYALIELWNMARDKAWVHVNDIKIYKNMTAATLGGRFASLRYWGLIEDRFNTDTKKRCSGYWRITDLGCEFVLNRVRIPKTWRVFDMQQYYSEGAQVNIKQCLGKKFNYAEVLDLYRGRFADYEERQTAFF
jgi:hypothetical protein